MPSPHGHDIRGFTDRTDLLSRQTTVRRRVGPTREESRPKLVEERPAAVVIFDFLNLRTRYSSKCGAIFALLAQFAEVQTHRTKDFDDFRAFAAIRVEAPDAMKRLKRGRSHS